MSQLPRAFFLFLGRRAAAERRVSGIMCAATCARLAASPLTLRLSRAASCLQGLLDDANPRRVADVPQAQSAVAPTADDARAPD